MCGEPARTVGWRDPGFIHTAFMKGLWPNKEYYYKIGHELQDGSVVWGKPYTFRAPPSTGQNSLQRVIVFGDMGKAERDGSNEFANYQPGSLNTTDALVRDLDNYAHGYISQWDQFTAQVAPITATNCMIASTVVTTRGTGPTPAGSSTSRTPAASAACWPGRDHVLLPGREQSQLLVQGGLRDVSVLHHRLRARLAGGHGAVQVHQALPLDGGPEAPALAHLHGAPRPGLLLQRPVRHEGLLRGARGQREHAEAAVEVPRRHHFLRPRP
uniref:Purple acid phosphatase N-terminal domain-containing protein n=1 Tax=Setaria viridis TaxID=4556 RepID=A0A4U6UAI3_SETVI|nr:hypothetical protein SEVIR_6G229932v2 [Setaria viridis]